jgi:tetratricopeptide (TPR) repeat protein
VTLINLGAVACEQGALDRADAYYIEALDLHDELGSERGVAYAVQGLGEVATSRGDYEAAARLLGAAEATRERIGVVLSPAEQEDVDRFLSKARAGVGEAAFERSWKAGRGSGPRPARSVSAWRDQLELD